MSGQWYRCNDEPFYKVGDILRYDTSTTALMEVTFITDIDIKPRYYGIQCMGSLCSNSHDQCSLATADDLRVWESWKSWRNPETVKG